MKPNLRDPATARLLARAEAVTPPLVSWWAEKHADGTDVTWDEWTQLARDAYVRMNAVRVAYNKPGQETR